MSALRTSDGTHDNPTIAGFYAVTVFLRILTPKSKLDSMSKYEHVLAQVLGGACDGNIAFHDLCQLLVRIGFEERIRGDHHIFSREGIVEIINLQPKGGRAKPYQVKQVRDLILKYKLGGSSVD